MRCNSHKNFATARRFYSRIPTLKVICGTGTFAHKDSSHKYAQESRPWCVFRQTAEGGSSLPIPCILYERRSLVARLLLVTGSHVRTWLHRVLLVTAPTKDPSIFSQSRRKFSPRARLAYISHCTGCVFCAGHNYRQPHKVPICTR